MLQSPLDTCYNDHFVRVTAEAIHLATMLASHGYIFPIDDHILAVKNDSTYYRFQVLNSGVCTYIMCSS